MVLICNNILNSCDVNQHSLFINYASELASDYAINNIKSKIKSTKSYFAQSLSQKTANFILLKNYAN